MKSERSIRGLAGRWSAVGVMVLLGCAVCASVPLAKVQTFFVNVPAASEQRVAMELCRDRFTAALVRVEGFRANQDAVTQQSVADCLGEKASAAAKRECEVSMANIEVDFLILPTVRRLGNQWNWSIKVLSPAQGAAQVWGGDQSVGGDASEAGYEACDSLARQFACDLGVSAACVGSGFGAGPILGAEAAAPSPGSGPARAQPARAKPSALEVLEPTPQVVSVWIDGKEAGTSENQITGVPAGQHSVTLKATGHFDHTEQLTFAAGLPTELKLVRLRKTTATLRVELVEPAVATVFIGGRERGTTASPLAGIAPGEVEVVLRAEGYRERRERVTLEADQETVLAAMCLEALPATLTVTANILGAEIVVDGAVVGTTTGEADAFELAPTAKQLEVRRSGYAPFAQRLSLRPGSTEEVRANLSRVQAAPAAPAAVLSSGATGGCLAGYVRIAPGTFTMGSPKSEDGHVADESQHSVTITRAYCMKVTEVTQGEWQAVMGNNPSKFKKCGANCPVEQVSWDDAVGYANALSRRDGLPECYAGATFTGLGCRGYRLPTEAEWEYAARGPTSTNLASVAWYGKNSDGATHPVGQKQPNAWGLYDMLGNVWEWTGDWYAADAGAVSDPTGSPAGSSRVYRGGWWYSDARYARAANRAYDPPGSRADDLGFRLVRAPVEAVTSTEPARAAPAAGSFSGATGGCQAGYVSIPPGTFTMGSPADEEGRSAAESQHSVTIPRGYCMMAAEVTQGEWQAVMWSNPSHFENCGANCPVEQVSWDDIVFYANALSRRDGLPECYSGSTFKGLGCWGYRLPTEAEWEYAARAGTTGATYGNLDSVAWYGQNSASATHPVGQKQPNAWGLYDMIGNVWEWTGDWYGEYSGAVTDPSGPAAGSSRVIRGGSWGNYARDARAAYRNYGTAVDRYGHVGFRLVRTAP